MSVLIFIILWIAFSVAIAIRAKHRNRWPFGWFLLSFFLSPVVAICLLLILPERASDPLWIDAQTVEKRKRDGALALVVMAPIVVVVLFGLAAPFIFH